MGGHTGGNERDQSRNWQPVWHYVDVKRSKYNMWGEAHSPAKDRYELCESTTHKHTHKHTGSSSPLPSPHLYLWAQPGRLLSTREGETYTSLSFERHIHTYTHTHSYTRTHTHTQCHKPMRAVHVKVKWSRKTNRCVSGKPLVQWAATLE